MNLSSCFLPHHYLCFGARHPHHATPHPFTSLHLDSGKPSRKRLQKEMEALGSMSCEGPKRRRSAGAQHFWPRNAMNLAMSCHVLPCLATLGSDSLGLRPIGFLWLAKQNCGCPMLSCPQFLGWFLSAALMHLQRIIHAGWFLFDLMLTRWSSPWGLPHFYSHWRSDIRWWWRWHDEGPLKDYRPSKSS